MKYFTSLLVLTLSRLESLSAAHAQCYYPDGSIPADYIWEPCTGSKYSSCCVPSEGDICQADGLCYYPANELVYRGTCTDQTWKDPSCNVDKCVSGFETTWQWVGQCLQSGSTSIACGSISDGAHATPTCAGNAVLNTVYVSTTSTSSAHVYSAPPPIDTARFSIETDTYTTTITATAQTTTLTSTFQSTKTNTLSQTGTGASSITTPATAETSAASGDVTKKKKSVTVSIGMLVGVMLGFLLVVAIGVGIILYVRRKKQSFKKIEAVKPDSNTSPPPNGPVGDEQVYPYEAPVNESLSAPKKYMYTSPRLDAYEMDDRAAMLREKRGNDVAEMHADGELRSPAPAYHEAMMPVELDGTSSIVGARGR